MAVKKSLQLFLVILSSTSVISHSHVAQAQGNNYVVQPTSDYKSRIKGRVAKARKLRYETS